MSGPFLPNLPQRRRLGPFARSARQPMLDRAVPEGGSAATAQNAIASADCSATRGNAASNGASGPDREFGPHEERGRDPAEGLLGIPGTRQSRGQEETNRRLASARLGPRKNCCVGSCPAVGPGTGIPALVGRARPGNEGTPTQTIAGLRQASRLPGRPDPSVTGLTVGTLRWNRGTAATLIHQGEATARHVDSRTCRSSDPAAWKARR